MIIKTASIIASVIAFAFLVYISKYLFDKYTFKSKLEIAKKRTHKKIAKDFRPKLEIQKEQQKL